MATGIPVSPVSISLQTIIDAVRHRLNNYEQPYYWSDSELVQDANEVMRQFLSETRMLVGSYQFALVDGTADYELSDRVISIRNAKISVAGQLLKMSTFDEIYEKHPGWRTDNEGEPTYIITDYIHPYISFYPIPDTAYTCDVRAYKIHDNDFTTTDMDTQSLEIPDIYFRVIVDGIVAIALLKSGPNTYDPQKGQIHRQEFMNGIKDAKRSLLRLHNKKQILTPHLGCR